MSISTAPGCVWTVTGVPAWVALTSAATVTNSGAVQFNVQANTTANSRSATLSVANLSYIITQAVETSPPSTPTLTVTPVSPSQLNLSWTTSTDTGGSGLAGYKVYRAGVQITTTTSTSYSDTGLSASTQYCYTVAAYDNAGNTSSQSSSQCATTSAAPDATAPSVPSGLTAVTVSPSQINLNWAASTDAGGSGLAGYKVYRAGVQIATTTATSYTNTGLLSSTSYCYTVAAYDNAGNTSAPSGSQCATTTAGVTWVEKFGGTGSDLGVAAVHDSSGNVFAAGTFSLSATFGGTTLTSAGGRDIYIVKVSSTGTLQWLVRVGGTGNEYIATLKRDSAGNIFIAGSFNGTANFGGANHPSLGSSDAFLAKYTSQGAYIWSRTFGSTYDDAVISLALDATEQNIFATGRFVGVVAFSPTISIASGSNGTDTFLAKYSVADGSTVWARNFPSQSFDEGEVLFVDGANSLILVGIYRGTINLGSGTLTAAGTSGGYDIYAAKYTASGSVAPSTPLWSRTLGGTGSELLYGGGGIDASGNFTLAGTFFRQTDLGTGVITGTGFDCDLFVANYSGVNGQAVWVRHITCTAGGAPRAVRFDNANNSVVVGSFYGTSNFGAQSVISVSGTRDIFAVKYATSNGDLLWGRTYGGTGTDEAVSVSLDSAGFPVLTGSFVNTVNFDGVNKTSAGFGDAFVLKIAP